MKQIKRLQKLSLILLTSFTLFVILFGFLKTLIKNDIVNDICIVGKHKIVCIKEYK